MVWKIAIAKYIISKYSNGFYPVLLTNSRGFCPEDGT
jgi:hypothetical protein